MKAMDGMLAFGLVPVVLAAQESGLLDELDRGAGNAEDLAQRSALHPRATRLVLDALTGLGVCTRDDDGVYQRPTGFERALPWDLLPAFLASGEVHPAIDGPARGEAYAEVVRMLGRRFAPWARVIAESLPAAERILDVGAGSGVWSLAMAVRSTTARVTAIDLPAVLPRFLEHAREHGLEGRVEVIAGTYFDAVADGPFDRVVLGNVLHLETPKDAARLVDRFVSSLAPGGELVVVDCVGEGDAHEPARSLYALHLGLRTARGAVHRAAEILEWCARAGLVGGHVRTFEQVVPAMGVVVANRPE